MVSNEEPTKMFGEGDRALSRVSQNYDLGSKGFLTDTEKQMRGMDSDNVGHLTNAQVSLVVAETLQLREKTDRMKMWLGILGVAVVILALSNLGTAFAAAWLAKDTTVDEWTGQLMVKDSDIPVTVQSTGQTSNLVLVDSSYGCMDQEDAANLWNGVLDGTASAITIQESSQQEADIDPTLQAFLLLGLATNGATWNETMACMPVSDGSGDKVCIDFTDHRCDVDHRGRALEVIDHHTRRKLFHAAGQGHRALTHTEFVLTVALAVPSTAAAYAVDLESAENYVILSETGITTVPTSAITGDIAVSPQTSTALTGFSQTIDSSGEFSTSIQVTGKVFAPDYTAGGIPALLTHAIGHMRNAYITAEGRPPATGARLDLGAGTLGGGLINGGVNAPLTAGVYTFGTAVSIPNDITFSGSDTDIFIIQIAGTLTVSSGVIVTLVGGSTVPLASNIFWQVSGAVSVGTTAQMKGIILGKTGVTFLTGASLDGRIYAQTAVVLGANRITKPPSV